MLTISSTNHRELLRLDAISSPLFPIILGLPWLQAHNPQIDWKSGSVKFQSAYCQRHCLETSPPSPATLLCMDADPKLCQVVPNSYHEYLDVFSKRGADTLPPHRPYDCPIELLPGAEIPFGRIFPLSESGNQEFRRTILMRICRKDSSIPLLHRPMLVYFL